MRQGKQQEQSTCQDHAIRVASCKACCDTQLIGLTRTLEKQSQSVKVCVCACPPVVGRDLLLTGIMIMQAAHRLLRVCFCDIMMLHRTTAFCQKMLTLAALVPARATICAEMLFKAALQALCFVSACCIASSSVHPNAGRKPSVDGQCMRSYDHAYTWEKKCSGKPRPMAKHDINFIDMSWQAAMKAAAASAKPAQSASLGHLSAVWKPRDMDSFISGVPVEGRICSDQYLE